MSENIQPILQSVKNRARKVISSVMNVDEKSLKFLSVEFSNGEIVMYFSSGLRTFKVIANLEGEIKSVEEVVNIEQSGSSTFCIDKRSAIIIVARRFPEWRIVDIWQVKDGYRFRIQADGKTRIIKVGCDGKVIVESGMYKVIKGIRKVIESIIGRMQ
ncbi:MAG: hypothetical protein GXO23_03705 [Crenarchaeota archaeon]|nr:hypothetical protein [Thermoproteota archaeon]